MVGILLLISGRSSVDGTESFVFASGLLFFFLLLE